LPVNAPSHAQGGIQMNLPSGTRILGKKVMDDGKQFKEVGRKLSRVQSKYLKVLEQDPTSIETNTVKHSLKNIQKEFDNLYKEQGVDINQEDMSMDNKYAKGGTIHIKPENKGKFNATKVRTGKSTEELTHSSNPLTRKRAVFAQNAKKWKHKEGGVVIGSKDPSTVNVTERSYTEQDVYSQYVNPSDNKEFYAVKRNDYNLSNPNVFQVEQNIYGTYLNPNEGNTKSIQYEPSKLTRYGDTGEVKIAHPTGYEKYMKTFAKGGVMGKYDEPNKTNNWSMTIGNSQWGVQQPTYQAPQVQQYQMDQNVSPSLSNASQVIKTDPFAQEPVAQQQGFNRGQFGNIASTVASLAPVVYNIVQGSKGSQQLNYQDYLNPYNDYVNSLMSNRRYNAEPEFESNRLNQATYQRNLNEAAPSQAQLLGGMQAGSIQKQRADAETIARQQNMNNQYQAEEAQMRFGVGQGIATTKAGVQDINARNQASARNMTATGLSQVSNFAQNKQITHNQIIRDAQRMGLLDDLISNYSFKNGEWTFKATDEKVEPQEVLNKMNLNYAKGY